MSEAFEKFRRLLDSGVRNLSQSFYDHYVEANAKFRSKAGLKVTIVRETLGECCDWCSDLAGIYSYENAPDEIYARHRDCNCIVSTKTEKGTWQDAWNKEEYNTYRENRIAREQEIIKEQKTGRIENVKAKTLIRDEAPKYRNVTADYWKNATPGEGKVKKAEGFIDKGHEEERTFANWLHNTLGGDIILNEDSKIEGFHFADFTWNEKLWDLKTISSNKYNTIDQHIRDGHKQIMTNRGGIMIDMSKNKMSMNEMLNEVTKSLQNRNLETTDILIKKNQLWGFFRVYVNK